MTQSPAAAPSSAVDVVVAGSGAAGLTAALTAAGSGARVLLVERAAELGGTTALSFGRVWVPASHLSAGDTPDAARAYLEGLFSDRYPHMMEAFVESAPVMALFAEQQTPLRFTACVNYPDYHPARPGATAGGRALDIVPVELAKLTSLAREIRCPPGYLPLTHAEWEVWRYPQRFDWTLLDERQRRGIRAGGAGLAAALLDGAVRSGVRVLTGTRLVKVRLGPRGSVSGVDLEHGDQVSTHSAAAVILATGGFDWNEGLRARMLPRPLIASGASPTNTGDALCIAADLGAEIDNMSEGWWMPMMAVPGETLDGRPHYRSLIRERALPRQIMVNAAGRRFTDEALPYHEIGKAMHHRDPDGGYPNGTAWMIFDEGFRRSFPVASIRPGQPLPGWVARADSVSDLASRIAVGGAVLAGTIAGWNRGCAAGGDPEFGRGNDPYERYMGDPGTSPNPNLGPIDRPPFYAIRVLAGTIGTKGGPVTDADTRILTDSGRPVPGLYAAGNAAAFWTADGYPGPGATLAIAMTMGYLAGRHAARYRRLAR